MHPAALETFKWFAGVSKPMMVEYDAFCAVAKGKTRFIDAGSCHGVYSLTFATLNPDGRVIAVDPSPTAREVLTANIALNRCGDRITVLDCAAGAAEATLRAQPNDPRHRGVD